jgi:hypothetical protein
VEARVRGTRHTLIAALSQFKLDQDSRGLYGDAIEDAISDICGSDPARLPLHEKKTFIAGLRSVALLFHARYRSGPTRPARFSGVPAVGLLQA